MTDMNPITMKSGLADVPPALAFFVLLLFIMAVTALMLTGGEVPGDANTISSAVTVSSETCATAPCETAI